MRFLHIGLNVMSLNYSAHTVKRDHVRHQEIDVALQRWPMTEIWIDPISAQDEASRRLVQSREIEYRDGEAWALVVLAGAVGVLGHYSDSEKHLDLAEKLFSETGNELGLGHTILRRDLVWLDREDFITALDRLPQALEISRKYGDIDLEIEVLNDMGLQFCISGQAEEGIEHLFAGLERARSISTRTLEGLLSLNIGSTLLDRGELGPATEWLNNSLALFEALDDISGAAFCNLNLAEAARQQNRPLEALEFLGHSLRDARRSSFCVGIALAKFEEGQILAELGRTAEAVEAFTESALESRAKGDEFRSAWACLADWWIAKITNTYTLALLTSLQRAQATIQRKAGSLKSLFTVFDALVDTCQNLGDTRQALEYARNSTDKKEQYWRNLAERRTVQASKMHQVQHAQSMAERERFQRLEVEKLDQTNERLVVQLREQATLLEKEATEDSLTLLGNRRFFEGQLERELLRAYRFDRPVSVALADIDRFKQVNDQFSHRIGDQVLKRVAEILRSTVRETDVIARYGGEEFAFLLLETDLIAAEEISNRIRSHIERFDWSTIAPALNVTISIGVVSGSGSISNGHLMASADAMLYLAKHRGRNLVKGREMSDPDENLCAADLLPPPSETLQRLESITRSWPGARN